MPFVWADTFSSEHLPFHCKECARPFAKRFDPNLFFEAPAEIHAHEGSFDVFADWIHRLLNGSLAPSACAFLDDIDDAPERMKETTIMWLLMGLEPLDCDPALLTGLRIPLQAAVFRPVARRCDDPTIAEEHVAIYRALRRRLRRQTARLPGCGRHKRLLRGGNMTASDASSVPAAVVAFIRWRDAMEFPEGTRRDPLPPRGDGGRFAKHPRNTRGPYMTAYARPIWITDNSLVPPRTWARFAIATYAAMRANEALNPELRWELPWPRRMSLIAKPPYFVLMHHRISSETVNALP